MQLKCNLRANVRYYVRVNGNTNTILIIGLHTCKGKRKGKYNNTLSNTKMLMKIYL